MLIYGINPVLEALRAGRVKSLRVSERAAGRAADVITQAERAGISVRRVQATELDRVSRGGVHQGVVAEVADAAHVDVSEIVSGARGVPLLVVLDGVEDPH